MALSEAMAGSGDGVRSLVKELDQLPMDMIKFSLGLKDLFSTKRVTEKAETKKFLKVRDDVRKNAVVYSNKILPVTEEVVRAIGFHADYFEDLDFEEWSENLQEIIEDLEESEDRCAMLHYMHMTILENLSTTSDDANEALISMEDLKTKYEEKAEQLVAEARILQQSADGTRAIGKLFSGFTFGISILICDYIAENVDVSSKAKTTDSIAMDANAMVMAEASFLTKETLIPAVQDFINAVEAIRQFLVKTKETLKKMHKAGDKGLKKIHYNTMKKKSKGLSDNCMKFLMLTDVIRHSLKSIPSEPGDKNFVDKWLEQEKAKIQKNNSVLGKQFTKMLIESGGIKVHSHNRG